MIVCGLRPLLESIEALKFGDEELGYLGALEAEPGRLLFDARFLEWLADFRFRGEVHAMSEGTVCFPGEPVLRVEGGVAECQLLETLVLNQMNYASAVATKAARLCHVAAKGQPVLEFGLRRAPGIGGGVAATRAAWIGGCSGTSNLMAGKLLGIPVRGTHAHSWVMAFDSERESFDAYVEALPHGAVLLVDTYDTVEGVRSAIEVARSMRSRGNELAGIRLDSGNLLELSRWARTELDGAGFPEVGIIASGGLDELEVQRLRQAGAAIDIWGVGTRLVSANSGIDGVFKMGLIRRSENWTRKMKSTDDPTKASLPGRLQVYRAERDGALLGDTIHDESLGRRDELKDERPLLLPVMETGHALEELDDRAARERVAAEVEKLPDQVRKLDGASPYPVSLAPDLRASIDGGR